MRTAQTILNHCSNDSEVTYLNASQVRARYGSCSHMFLICRMQDSGFPTPTYFGRLRFWRLSDLEAWEQHQATKSANRSPTGFQRKGQLRPQSTESNGARS